MPGPAVPTQDDAAPPPAPALAPGPGQQQQHDGGDDEDEFADDISVATVDTDVPPAGQQAPVDGKSMGGALHGEFIHHTPSLTLLLTHPTPDTEPGAVQGPDDGAVELKSEPLFDKEAIDAWECNELPLLLDNGKSALAFLHYVTSRY